MHSIRLAIVILAISIAGSANALVWLFNDPMDQSQVVPPSGSQATGTAMGNYDDITNVLNIFVTAGGFAALPNAAHIHGPAPMGANAGVQFNLGVAGGLNNYSNPVTMFNLSGVQETDFLNGLYYVQIHNIPHAAGAIRGQLNPTPVPEPASLIALGAGALALARRRRKA